jgi:hypothetical protein
LQRQLRKKASLGPPIPFRNIEGRGSFQEQLEELDADSTCTYFLTIFGRMTKISCNAGQKEEAPASTTSSNTGQSNTSKTDQGYVPVIATN